ncbi:MULTISPECIES: efflux RND transporter periplasmic adaptor subunit [Azospira]|jgi:cobalt-zinc-cadmium efflux system membrane fusion protein|uniref:Multidrug efflux pump subunit AcrA (Membrane-fusion protein) n=1 Tax=Azospira oryzae TaxID=146939 RepID=A0ABY0IRC9_9RHOO|nr:MULTISPECIES: HlyD family efflux transporter periplasmic adaptor subunit [Azospira]RZT90138.1 multidrug efflux pump subunit AcrA (membrane-fusion protein) [Azospira oryzae]BBN87396.1 hypothetical protein AZSP09_04190 [Azospira sp. I09]
MSARRIPSRLLLRASLAACLGAALALPAMPLQAHEGHGDEAAAPVSGDAPRRQADGSVFLPKASQRQIEIRTLPVTPGPLPRTLELNATVIMDPHKGGRVQSMLAGRLEPGPAGLPSVGQKVQKGQVLAYVVPSAGQIERSNQSALLAELQAARSLAEKRLARLQELADTVPRKDIEAAESEVKSLKGRIAAVGGGLSNRDTLVAPVTGVIAAANGMAGQIVEARDIIFEVVDPDSLHIEAMAYTPLAAEAIEAASVAVSEGGAGAGPAAPRVIPLEFLGAGRRLKEQALPVIFDNHSAGVGQWLALGQPVKVQVRLKGTLEAAAVPATALVKNPSNETILWVKRSPELFEPRAIRYQPLDGARVAVTQGLAPGDRVVVQGAPLLNQVR